MSDPAIEFPTAAVLIGLPAEEALHRVCLCARLRPLKSLTIDIYITCVVPLCIT